LDRPRRVRAVWLGHPSTALWSVLVAHGVKWLGFSMIVFLAALHALPAGTRCGGARQLRLVRQADLYHRADAA
jgi:hypothetical protein